MSEELPQILLLTHGKMAEGMLDSVQMLSGKADFITAIGLMEGQSPEDYLDKVRAAYTAMPEGSIILVDIFGGTPGNTVVRLARETKVYAMAGVNLGTLLSAVFARTSESGQALIDTLATETRDSVINMGDLFAQLGGE